MIRRTFFKWAAAAAVTALVEIRQFQAVAIPYAGGVELEPQPGEVYEESISSVLSALNQWNQRRVAVQGPCKTSGNRSFVLGTVCARGTHGCTVIHPFFDEAIWSREQWDEARQKWTLELKLRDGEKREVVGGVETLAKAMSKGMSEQSRRGFFGRAFAKGKQFEWEKRG